MDGVQEGRGCGLEADIRRQERTGELVRVPAVDPLALVGLLTPGPGVPAIRHRTVVYHDGATVPGGGMGRTSRAPTGDIGCPDRAAPSPSRVT